MAPWQFIFTSAHRRPHCFSMYVKHKQTQTDRDRQTLASSTDASLSVGAALVNACRRSWFKATVKSALQNAEYVHPMIVEGQYFKPNIMLQAIKAFDGSEFNFPEDSVTVGQVDHRRTSLAAECCELLVDNFPQAAVSNYRIMNPAEGLVASHLPICNLGSPSPMRRELDFSKFKSHLVVQILHWFFSSKPLLLVAIHSNCQNYDDDKSCR